MESTTATQANSKSQTRKPTTTGRQIGAQRTRTMQSSQQNTSAQLPKVIKKTYVRFDDYLDLNEENMRRSCKRLMNRLYKEPTTTNQTSASATASSETIQQQQQQQPLSCTEDKENGSSSAKSVGACSGAKQRNGSAESSDESATIVSASVATNGRSYLRCQFERRQQRQLAALLKSPKVKQAIDAPKSQQRAAAKEKESETGKVSSGATDNNRLHAQETLESRNSNAGEHDLVEIGQCKDDAMSSEAADMYQRQQMVQKLKQQNQQQQQQDSVARSHELSKRRFFEQLERRNSAAVVVANATRDISKPEVNSNCMQTVSKSRVLGQTTEPNTKDQKRPPVQESGRNNNHRQLLTRADKSSLLREEAAPERVAEEDCCWVAATATAAAAAAAAAVAATGEESENSNRSTQAQVRLDEASSNNNLIAWTQNLSATTNETHANIFNGACEANDDDEDNDAIQVASRANLSYNSGQAHPLEPPSTREQCVSHSATASDYAQSGLNGVLVANSNNYHNHQKSDDAGCISTTLQQTQTIDNYVNDSNMRSNVLGKQLGARLITDSNSSTLNQNGAVGIEACNSNRLKPRTSAAGMSNGLCCDVREDSQISDLSLTVELTRVATMFADRQSNESMFEIKVPAAGEPSGADQMDGVCDGYISELVVKQVAEVDGPSTATEAAATAETVDQVSKREVGIIEKEMISNDRGVNFGESTWMREAVQHNQQPPPTSTGRRGTGEAQRDAPTEVEAATTMIVEGNKMRKSIVPTMMMKPTMVARAKDCINASSGAGEDENKRESDVGVFEISNHKFKGIKSDGQQETMETATCETQNHEQQVVCEAGLSTFDMVAPAISNSISSNNKNNNNNGALVSAAAAVDNQNEEEEEAGRKKQLATRAPTTAISEIYDTTSHGSDTRLRDLRSDQVDTGKSSVQERDEIPKKRSTCPAGCTTDGPETDVVAIAICPQQLDKNQERQKQMGVLVEGTSSKVNGPKDKICTISAEAVAFSNNDKTKADDRVQCYGRSEANEAKRDATKPDHIEHPIPPSSCPSLESATAMRITHEFAPRDVLRSPEAVVDGGREDGYGGGGEINRLLVRNEANDDVKSGKPNHELFLHDYKLHDTDNSKVDSGSNGDGANEDDEETSGKEFREQVNEKKKDCSCGADLHEDPCAPLNCGANATAEQLAERAAPAALVSHPQSQWAEPDLSGKRERNKCPLNDANRLTQSFELMPPDQMVKQVQAGSTTAMNMARLEPVEKNKNNESNGGRDFESLKKQSDESMLESENAASSNNEHQPTNYNTKHSWKLCNDTCGGESGLVDQCKPESDSDRDPSYGRVIELSARAGTNGRHRALAHSRLADRAIARVHPQPSSSVSSSLSTSTSPVLSPLIGLSGVSRGTTNQTMDEDGCCGSSSCSSSGFGASVGSTDGSEAQTTTPTTVAPQPKDREATGVVNNTTVSKSASSMSLLAVAATSPSNLQTHPINACKLALASEQSRRAANCAQYTTASAHQSKLTAAPAYDYLRPSEGQATACGEGGLPAPASATAIAQLNGVCKQRSSLLDEFPDYKQLAVGPDEAYPKRSGRPLVVVENYGYAPVRQQQQQRQAQHCSLVDQVNSSALVKEHSYANIPCAAESSASSEPARNNMDSSTRRAATGTNNNSNNGYAIVRSVNIKQPTSTWNGSQMSFDQHSGESSASPQTSASSSSASTSSSTSSSHSAGFSALQPVRVHGCTPTNNFESLPPVLNSSNSGNCSMINSTTSTSAEAATSCHSNGVSHKTKASLLKRFGSMVSRALTNGTGRGNNNGIGSRRDALESNLEPPTSLPPTAAQVGPNSVGTDSNGQLSDQLKVEANACVAEQRKAETGEAVCESDLKDIDLVILPPKSQIAPSKTQLVKQVPHEQLSPRTQRCLDGRKPLRICSNRVSRTRKRAHGDKVDSASLSSLYHSSESLCSSANAHYQRQIHSSHRDSTSKHALNDLKVKRGRCKRYRKRASSLSEELESLISRSAIDTDANRMSDRKHRSSKQNQFCSATGAKQARAALLMAATSSSYQKQQRDSIENCYSTVVDQHRSKSMLLSNKLQLRFDIDCESRKGERKTLGVGEIKRRESATNMAIVENKNSSASLQMLRWFGREPNQNVHSYGNVGGQCLPKIESTPNLSKRASVLSDHSGGLAAQAEQADDDQAIDQNAKSHQNRNLRGSKVAQARNLSAATTDSIRDNKTNACDKGKAEVGEGFTSLIERSHADTDGNNTKLGRKCSSKQQEQKSKTKATKVAATNRRTRERQPTSSIYSNLLQNSVRKSSATRATCPLSASSSSNEDNDVDDDDDYDEEYRHGDERDSMLECDEEADRCKLCVVSLNQGADGSENSSVGGGNCSKNKCDSPSLYQILLRNYAKRRHTTAATEASATEAASLEAPTSAAPGRADERDARYHSLGSSLSRHHYHRGNHTSNAEESNHHRHTRTVAHRHTHRHAYKHSHRHHRSHHHHHRHHHRHHHCCNDTDRRAATTTTTAAATTTCCHSLRSKGELLDTNELRIRGTGSATSTRTPTTTTTTSGAESGADCCADRRMLSASIKSAAKTAAKGKWAAGSCCSETIAPANDCNSCNGRQAQVWGQLIKINRSDGTQVVELQRAPGKHWGFFVARGAINNVKGIFISRMHNNESSLNGLLSIGDRIIAIDESPIEPDHDIMRVNQMISEKSRILLKLKPLKG